MKETWARFLFWACFAVACVSAGYIGAGVWKYGFERIGWVLPEWLPLFGALGFVVAVLGLAFFPQWSEVLLHRPGKGLSQGPPIPSRPRSNPAEDFADVRDEDRRAVATMREALQQLSQQAEQVKSLQHDVLEGVETLRMDFRRTREAGRQGGLGTRGSGASDPAVYSGRDEQRGAQVQAPDLLDDPFSAADSTPATTPSLDAEALRTVWHTYRQDGDGNFNVRGFEIQLQKAQVDARVLRADQMPVYGPVLGLVAEGHEDLVHLVPDFTKPPTAMAKWFADQGNGTRQRVKQLHRVAIVEQGTGQLVQEGILS